MPNVSSAGEAYWGARSARERRHRLDLASQSPSTDLVLRPELVQERPRARRSAAASCGPAMLKLRSRAMRDASGKSPAVNDRHGLGHAVLGQLEVARTARPFTGFPELPVTLA